MAVSALLSRRALSVAASMLLGCLAAEAASAEQVAVYLKSGDVIRGELRGITQTRIEIDPPGEVAYRMFHLAEVDSVATVSIPRRRIFPVRQEHAAPDRIDPPRRGPDTSPIFAEGYYRAGVFYGYRRSVSVTRITIGDSAMAIPIGFELSSGTGAKVVLGSFFPLGRSGLAIGPELSIGSLEGDWELHHPFGVARISGSVLSFDGHICLRIPVSMALFPVWMTPGLGVGMRRLKGSAGEDRFEENHIAYLGHLGIDCQVARRFALSMTAEIWNSSLEDLEQIDMPRYTALEFQVGGCVYFH